MEGIKYLVDENQKAVAVQIDLEKYGEPWEDIYDTIVAQSRQDEESISLEDLITELKVSGKLDQNV
jgi:hypothetical protein